jgi:hypothetical protein
VSALDIGQKCTFGLNKKGEKKVIDDVLFAISQSEPNSI